MELLMSHDRGLFVIGNREFTFRALGPPTVTCIVDVFCTCSMTFVTRYVHPHKCNYVRQIILISRHSLSPAIYAGQYCNCCILCMLDLAPPIMCLCGDTDLNSSCDYSLHEIRSPMRC